MSNPTRGVLTLTTGLRLEDCNPSFVWSDDSRYLAVPRYFFRMRLFRRQRMAVIDVVARRVFVSPETAFYFQPDSFTGGELIATSEPFGQAEQVRWRIPDALSGFKELRVEWQAVRGGS